MTGAPYPGFPVKLLALMNFMRLSSMKAAHVAVAWCHVQEIRVSRSFFARYGIPRSYTGHFRLFKSWDGTSVESHISRKTSEIWPTRRWGSGQGYQSNGGASPFLFGPGTPGRTWGTRPVLTGFVATSELDCARSSSCLRQSSESTKYLDSRQFSSTITCSSR